MRVRIIIIRRMKMQQGHVLSEQPTDARAQNASEDQHDSKEATQFLAPVKGNQVCILLFLRPQK